MTLMYIAGDHADHVNSLTGKKTFTYNDMQALQGLGFSFEQILDPEIKD